ncbi:MAG: CBS domain-containing protein [Candidatus Pacearchaeota archaeon]
MKTGIKVGDIMTRNFVSCSPETSLIDAVKKMVKMKVGSIVVKTDDKLEGILTERDILNIVSKKHSIKGLKVKDVMEKRVITISPSKDIYDAILLMKKKYIRRLPVVEKNKLVGFITIRDIIKIFPSLFDVWAEAIRIKEESEKLKKIQKSEEEEEYYEEYLK